MSLKFKPVSLLKNFAAGLSVVTMCISPLAQGAAAKDQKKLINQYLKETGLTTKKMTVGEYWTMVRHVYPPKLQKQMDQWVSLNRTEMMPSVEATSFKDADGKDQVRLTLFKDGQSAVFTFTGDEASPLKVNGVPFSKNELLDYNKANKLAAKLAKQDKTLGKALLTGQQSSLSKKSVLTYNEYKKLTVQQKAEYLIRLRRAMEASQNVYKTFYGEQAYQELNKKYEWVLQFFLGDEAEAKAKGKTQAQSRGMTNLLNKPCVVAGYLSVYGENGSCGGNRVGAVDLKEKMSQNQASCSNNGVACNPMVYGFDSGGGAYCVARSEVKYATRVCNSKSPLQNSDPKAEGQNKKRIIESYLKKVKGQDINLVLNEEGKISEEQYKQISGYLEDLQGYINSAVAACDNPPLKDIQKNREDQVSACNEIRTRAFSLQSFAIKAEPVPPAPLIATTTCNDKKPGSVAGNTEGECLCPEGTKETNGQCMANAKDCNQPGQSLKDGECGCAYGMDQDGSCLLSNPVGKAGEDDSCGFWCRNKNWIIPVGVFAVAGGLMWWLLSGNKSKANNGPAYIPPAPVPDPGTGTIVTPPPVEPPPPAPCPAPNTYVNGVCAPPVIVPPPAPTSEGGTKVDDPGRAGGVR